MTSLTLLISTAVGYFVSQLISHPNSLVNKKLPQIKIKIIQFSPEIRINLWKKSIHVHHWLYYSIILIITVTSANGGVLDTIFSKGFLLGGIAQGFTFSDWKQIIKNRTK